MSETQKTTYDFTIRLNPEVGTQYDKLVSARHEHKSTLAARVLSEWVARQRSSLLADEDANPRTQLVNNLVASLTSYLEQNRSWAENVIESAGLSDFQAEQVYFRRLDHFHHEKHAISSRFVGWLLDRAMYYLEQGKKVTIAIESGTTLKSMFDELGPQLVKRVDRLVPLCSGHELRIITNNFPGAEQYEEMCNKPEHRTKDGKRLSDLVRCHVVPGRAMRAYNALLGEEAEEYLKNAKDPSLGKEVYLGLATGNWFCLADYQPVPLARGEGHKNFKDTLISCCDEVYLVSPLCKIFELGLDEFNRDFFENNPKEERYNTVNTRNSEKSRARLVSTYRKEPLSIVHNHARSVMAGLGSRPVTDEQFDNSARLAYGELPHFFFQFDEHSSRTNEEQMKYELPHKNTRKKAFREKYFQIPSF